MKKLITPILVLLSLSISSLSNAQKYQLHVGEIVKDKVRPDRFLGKDSSGNLYMSGLRVKYNVIVPLLLFNFYDASVQKYIKKYDSKMNLLAETPVRTLMDKDHKRSVVDGKIQMTSFIGFLDLMVDNIRLEMVSFGGKNYILSVEKNKSLAKITALELDLETGRTINELPIISFSTKGSVARSIDSVSFKVSADGSKAMVFVAVSRGYGAKKTGTFATAVVDKNMGVIWSKEFSLPKEKDGLTYKSVDIGNDGVVYFMSRKEGSNRKAPVLTMITVAGDKPAPVIKVINFGSAIINDGHLAMGLGTKPTLVGFYKDKKNSASYEGIYYANIDENGKVENVYKKVFTNNFIGSVFNKKESRRAERMERRGKDMDEDDSYVITDFVRTEDGGNMMVAEEYAMRVVTRNHTNSKGMITGTSQQFYYFYEDLIVVKIDKDGNLDYMKKIAKSNLYVQGVHIKPFNKDYAIQSIGSDHYFIYNDNADKMDNKHENRWKRFSTRSDATFIAHLNASGSLAKERLITKAQTDRYMFNPQMDLYRIDDHNLAFVMTKGRGIRKKTRMGTITIN